MIATTFERLSAALSGRYQVEREVGSGGMASVYLAQDLRHRRRVAIKVLKPELTEALGAERFLKEIEVTAKLQHTNILPLFDSGEVPATPDRAHAASLYYVMPFVEGESLRARITREKQLPLETALDLTRQIAAALEYAHRQGVIHRDIKPENILISNGQALVTDFGIALAVSAADEARLTQTGLSIGSPHYMSPEQATGERVIDARSDVYALGCVLYEMIAGDPPFLGSTAQAIMARKLTGSAPSLQPVRETVSKRLDDVIARALAKVPADRYPTMALFADAVARANDASVSPVRRRRRVQLVGAALGVALIAGVVWVVSTGVPADWVARPPRYTRVAILPLENRTGDSTQNYIVDGLTESVISDLARLEGVDVISLASVIGYRTAPKPVDSIARALDVKAVVAGSLQRLDGRLQVALQLLAPGTTPAPADTLDAAPGQIDALENRIVQLLVRQIGGKLTRERSNSATESPNAEVQQLYLRARYNLATRTPEGMQNALDYFRQVLALDPAHAPSYAGLAQYYSLLPFYTNSPPSEAFARAKAAAEKALQLDQYLPEAHGVLGYVRAYGDFDWMGAQQSYLRAVALQPSNADLHHALSRLHAALGRIPEAVAEAERAHVLDPLSLVAHANIGIIAYFARDYAEARRRLSATLEIDPSFSTAHWGLGLVHEQLGQPAQAESAFAKAIAIAGRGRNTLASLGHMLATTGRGPEAEAILNELTQSGRGGPINPYMLALVLVGLGRNDEALTMLEQSYSERSALLSYLGRDPRFDSLRSVPRFTALLRRMNLAQ